MEFDMLAQEIIERHEVVMKATKISARANRKQCVADAEKSIRKDAEVDRKLKGDRDMMAEKLEMYTLMCGNTTHTLVTLDRRRAPAYVEEYMVKLLDCHSWALDLKTSGLLKPEEVEPRRMQAQIHKLLEKKDESFREAVWREVTHRYSKHLDRTKPRSVPKVKTKKAKKGGKALLPLKTASLIYASCDLETCVSLRQANSYWSRVYSHADSALRPELVRRFPWIKPEGELKNWGDCVLVYVSRLASKKWQVNDGWDKIKISAATPIKHVVAYELGHNAKLPSTFEGFEDHRESMTAPSPATDCTSITRNRVHY